MDLNPDQQQKILDLWNSRPDNPPSLKELTQVVFGGDFDGRSEEGKSIKQFLASRNLRARASSDRENKLANFELSDEHKLYIVNNVATNTPLEIAKTLFNNSALTNLNAETRAIAEYVKSLDTKVIYGGKDTLEQIPSTDYEPPKTLDKALKKINEYVSFINGVGNLTASQKKSVERLIEYLHTYTFIRLMNTFDLAADRKTCEDAFIRYTYDKPDLTQEEIDQYIELCHHKVQGFKVQRRSEALQRRLEEAIVNTDSDKEYSMKLVEAIGKASTEYHQCIDRQKKLLESLTQRRSARLDSQINDSATILNLVQAWKNEEERKKFLKYAEIEQKAVAEEVDRLESIPELKARFMGLPKDRALYG